MIMQHTLDGEYAKAMRKRRRYRVRDDHLLRPHTSAWTQLRSIDDDSGWMDFTGFTKAAAVRLFELMAPLTVLPLEATGLGRPRRLTPFTSLAVTLHWLHSRGTYRDVAMHFGCPRSTVSRYVRHWVEAMATHLPTLKESRIGWPNRQQLDKYAAMIADKYPDMDLQLGCKTFAFMDGCNFGLQNQWDLTLQRDFFNPLTRSCKVGNLFIWAPDGLIIYQQVNCPGVMHDSTIASDAYYQLDVKIPDGYAILADSAFSFLGGKILKPLTIAQLVRAPEHEQEMSRIISGMRVPCEWGNRGLQAAFPRLHNLLPVDHFYRLAILLTTIHLSNFRTRVMDYGQIRAVFHRDYVRSGLAKDGPNGLDRYLAVASARMLRRTG